VGSSPERREDAVRPVVGGDVEPTKHLRRSDRFRVHPHLFVHGAALGQRLHQHVDAAGLAGAGRAERHHAMTDQLSLVQLDQLQYPRRMRDQSELTHLFDMSINIPSAMPSRIYCVEHFFLFSSFLLLLVRIAS